jgi:guanylate kinase
VESISYTTRQPRENEVDGVHYHFIGKEEFERKIAEEEFLEFAKVYGDYYGTSKKWVEEKRAQGKHVVLVIDTQGAMQVKDKCSAIFIFVLPPSFEVLRDRLKKRKTETPEVIEKRLDWARHEVKVSRSYDYAIENRDLEATYQVLRSIFIAEEHRRVNQ